MSGLLFVLLAGCGNVSNQGERERPIYDLGAYALTASPSPAPGEYRIAEMASESAAPAADSLFMKDGSLWAFQDDGIRDLTHFRKLNAVGAVEEEYTSSRSRQDPIFAATADDAGTIWVALNDGIAEFDPETESFGRRIAGASLPNPVLAAAGSYLYRGGGQTLLRLDLTSGLVVEDLSTTLKNALGNQGGWAIGAIGVKDNEVLIKLRTGSSDAVILDRTSGAFVGFAGDVPTGNNGDFAGSALLGGETMWFGVNAPGTIVTFSLGAPLPMPTITHVSALDQSGARALTFARDEIWVLYASQDNRLEMVAYDPNTQEPTQGFAIAPDVAAELHIPDDGFEPYAVTFQGDEIYVVSTSPYVGNETRVRVIDYATGALTRSFDVPEILTGVCHDGRTLWGARAPGGYAAPPTYVPSIHRLNTQTGLAEGDDIEAPFALAGWPTLVCTDAGVSLSTEITRQWLTFSNTSISTSTSTATSATSAITRHAFLIPSAGASGAVSGDEMWLLDRERNLLFETSLPSSR
ncbi:MAG: hypothetical protein IPK13_05850 [Deltaproteobacteria bacterium]|nr:hypothetical protein [Deltaproteobacteria bacterium]